LSFEVRILTTTEEFDQFAKTPGLGLDYRVRIEDSKSELISSFLSDFTYNADFITTRTFILYKAKRPVGVSTVVIEPKASFRNLIGLRREKSQANSFEVCRFSELISENREFAIIRGWRVIRERDTRRRDRASVT
jgi:hypothetical protein